MAPFSSVGLSNINRKYTYHLVNAFGMSHGLEEEKHQWMFRRALATADPCCGIQVAAHSGIGAENLLFIGNGVPEVHRAVGEHTDHFQ